MCFFFFFFNDTATTEIYTLSLHDALPISWAHARDRAVTAAGRPTVPRLHPKARLQHDDVRGRDVLLYPEGLVALNPTRSEEHTSELQSLAYLVCRLLLEKKKIKKDEYNSP